MIKKVDVQSRQQIDRHFQTEFSYFPHKGQYWHLISIWDTPEPPLINSEFDKVFTSHNGLSRLSLQFSDITEKNFESIKKNRPDVEKYTLFSVEQAESIIEFINATSKFEEDSVLVVHCTAGISRSGAVGTFANDFFNLDYKDFLTHNPYVHANPWVLSNLRRKSGMTPIGSHDGVNWEEEGGLILPPWATTNTDD